MWKMYLFYLRRVSLFLKLLSSLLSNLLNSLLNNVLVWFCEVYLFSKVSVYFFYFC